MTKKVRVNGNKIEIGNTVIYGLNNDFLEYIKDLQKKAELGEHYKHLYSKVKKQKDDVVEYIKSAIENDDIEELKDGRHLLLWNEDLDKLLRMLGEIDD